MRAANLRINQMLADYGDVVPRREFEMMETSYRVQTIVYSYANTLLVDTIPSL